MVRRAQLQKPVVAGALRKPAPPEARSTALACFRSEADLHEEAGRREWLHYNLSQRTGLDRFGVRWKMAVVRNIEDFRQLTGMCFDQVYPGAIDPDLALLVHSRCRPRKET